MPARMRRLMHPPWCAFTALRRRRLDAIARELACDYRVIAYDRGCGESGDAADGRYDLAAKLPTCRPLSSILALRQTCSRTVPVRWWRWSFSGKPAIISRAILHEPAVTDEGAGLGAAPVLLEMIAAGKVSRALRAFLGAIGDSDPEAPKLAEAEAKHALRNGRSFMANEYGITMTCVPDWDSVRASKTVAAVLLGELSIGTPREAGTRIAAELLDCPLVMVPGAHNGLRDRPTAAAQTVRGILGL
ncbi:MAG: alpha/beta fold hydrolase [Collinsella sp.]